MDMTVNETALDAKAVDVFVAEQADVTPASESDPVPKRFRKARRAACAGLAVVLAFVVLLVAEILLTDPRRGATTPRDLELFLNRVRLFRALAARRTRPDVETRSQTTNCHTAAAIDPIRSIATLHRNSPSISRPFRRSTGTAWCQSRLTLGLCAQDDGSIKTAFTISQEIEGRKRSWHDLELNALKCEIFAAHAPTDEEAAPERLALVDVDLEILKPLSLAVGENELSGSLVFSRLNHASLARVVSDFNRARHGLARQVRL